MLKAGFSCFIILTLVPYLAVASGVWEIIRDSEPEAKTHLYYVQFFDESRGFVYGHSRLLLTTKNGGRTWSKKNLPAPAGVFISSDEGVFMLNNATYLHIHPVFFQQKI